MTWVRVVFHVHCQRGEYDLGLPYDVENTEEIRALAARGCVTIIPYYNEQRDEPRADTVTA